MSSCVAACGVTFNVTSTFYRPSGDGQVRVRTFADSIEIPLASGVTLLLTVSGDAFPTKSILDREIGMTLWGQLKVPPGHRARFQAPFFTVMADGEQGTRRAQIVDIHRNLHWERNGKTWAGQTEQHLSPADDLVGWGPREFLSSGLVPATAGVRGEFHNTFFLRAALRGQVYPAVEVLIPPMEVDGKEVSGKMVRFKKVTEWHAILFGR
jgi:hypothetical protein